MVYAWILRRLFGAHVNGMHSPYIHLLMLSGTNLNPDHLRSNPTSFSQLPFVFGIGEGLNWFLPSLGSPPSLARAAFHPAVMRLYSLTRDSPMLLGWWSKNDILLKQKLEDSLHFPVPWSQYLQLFNLNDSLKSSEIFTTAPSDFELILHDSSNALDSYCYLPMTNPSLTRNVGKKFAPDSCQMTYGLESGGPPSSNLQLTIQAYYLLNCGHTGTVPLSSYHTLLCLSRHCDGEAITLEVHIFTVGYAAWNCNFSGMKSSLLSF